MAKSMKLGGGGRFAAMKKHVEEEGYSPESTKRIAASAGIKKYGAHKMSQMAHHSKMKKAIRKRRSSY